MKNGSTCGNTQWVSGRRDFLRRTSVGFGWLALSALHARWAQAQSDGNQSGGYQNPLAPKKPHFPARAERVIFIFLNGGPSHLDTFEWKPELAKVGGDASARYLAPVYP